MKLIIENNNGTFYAYRESEKHHKHTEPSRQELGRKLPVTVLDNECTLNLTLEPNDYIVIDLP